MVSQKGRQAQTSIYLPVETLERLQQLSKSSRIPMAAYLREAVEDLLKKHEEPKLKKRNLK
jgi:predicted DNA-binding protein